MKRLLMQLWSDDRGAVISGELLLISTVLVLGIIPGIVALRNGIVTEMTELANAIVAMNGSGSSCPTPVLNPPTSISVVDADPCN